IIVDHTDVPEALRGTGAGLALAERLVADMRAEGVRVVALCPFVKAQARKHPDWADVIE
ncbi:MAG: GNAT family N-acetyltransferase, partial [Pseudomonadota bacterium]